MVRANDSASALEAGTVAGLKDTFQLYNATLENVQKKLEQYLETKRTFGMLWYCINITLVLILCTGMLCVGMAFPRFYFLSNDELLEILAKSKNINAVQPHLRKCFEGLCALELVDKDIVAMISSEVATSCTRIV